MLSSIPKIFISNGHIFRIIFTIIVCFWLFSYLTASLSFLTSINYFLSLFLMMYLIVSSQIHRFRFSFLIIIYSFLILITFIISRFYYLTPSFSALTIILNIWLGVGLYIYGAYFNILKFLHITFCLYVLTNILVLDIAPSSVMLNSYNHLSIVSIGLLALSNFSFQQNQKRFFLFQIFLTFLVCVFSIGRSGILSSFTLLILVNTYFLHKSDLRTSYKRFIFLFFLLFLFISVVLFLNSDLAIRFIASSMDLSGREEIFSRYFSSLGLIEFFIGHDINFTRANIDPKLSIHNSYLGMHQGAGIFGLILAIFTLFILPFLMKQNFILFSLYLTIILRALTDNILYTNGFIYGTVATAFILYTISNIKVYFSILPKK